MPLPRGVVSSPALRAIHPQNIDIYKEKKRNRRVTTTNDERRFPKKSSFSEKPDQGCLLKKFSLEGLPRKCHRF
jgi:hypothetical protein